MTESTQAVRDGSHMLWLWKNFVNGRPEYWAFDNPYPCVSVGGDPLTLGEPCGYAILKQSVNGRPSRPASEAFDAMVRTAAKYEASAASASKEAECERLREALTGLLAAHTAPLPDVEDGLAAQHAWAERQRNAEAAARAALQPQAKEPQA